MPCHEKQAKIKLLHKNFKTKIVKAKACFQAISGKSGQLFGAFKNLIIKLPHKKNQTITMEGWGAVDLPIKIREFANKYLVEKV